MAIQLSRKRKPLGPRQRLAYVKPFREAVAIAKAKVAGEQAAVDAAKKVWAAAVKRFDLPIVRTDSAGARHEVDHLGAATVWGIYEIAKKSRAKARKELLEGQHSVSIGNGSPKLANAAKRIRLIAKADQRKRARLEARLRVAQQALADHVVEAWNNGTPVTPERLADSIIGLAVAKPGHLYVDTWAVNRAEADLATALLHDGTAACPCARCVRDRTDVERQKRYAKENEARAKAQARELAKLGTRTFTCPQCGELNTDSQVMLDENDGEKFVECSSCDTGTFLEDLDEAAAIAAKATAPSPGQIAIELPEQAMPMV